MTQESLLPLVFHLVEFPCTHGYTLLFQSEVLSMKTEDLCYVELMFERSKLIDVTIEQNRKT